LSGSRPCLFGVGFPSFGPRVWTFTSYLLLMPIAQISRRLRLLEMTHHNNMSPLFIHALLSFRRNRFDRVVHSQALTPASALSIRSPTKT
jgi:hypothetical protein